MKPSWMPENPYPECSHDKSPIVAFNDGCQQTAHKILEWGTKECKEHNPKGAYMDRVLTPIYYKRFECPTCMVQFKKEVALQIQIVSTVLNYYIQPINSGKKTWGWSVGQVRQDSGINPL